MEYKWVKFPEPEDWPYNATHWHPVTELYYVQRGGELYPITNGNVGNYPTPIKKHFVVRYVTESVVTRELEKMESKYEQLIQALKDSFSASDKLKELLFKK